MRFHDKNNAVNLLREGGPLQVNIDPDAAEFTNAAFFMRYQFCPMRSRFRQSIQFICQPFFEAYLQTREKLIAALPKEAMKKSGTLIYGIGEGCRLTIFYDLETKGDARGLITDGWIVALGSHPAQGIPKVLFYSHIVDGRGAVFHPERRLQDPRKNPHFIFDVLSLLLFIKYCPVETRLVAKGKKITHSQQGFLNKTELPIEIVDSTWFTTIIRSEGFGVSGHFRLQPVGPSLVYRKLVWIAPYEKTGYVRTAKVLRVGDGGDRLPLDC